MNQSVHFIFLIAYAALSYLYFVERNFTGALYFWLVLLITSTLLQRSRPQTPLLLLIGSCFCFLNLIHKLSPFLRWPLDFFLTALFGFAVLRFVFRSPAAKLKWSFVFSKWEWFSILAINIPALFVLIFYYRMNPEVANMWPIPKLPLWSTPFIIILIAAVNGLREEIFYRGLLQPASSKRSPVWFTIALQMILFGFLHFTNAFPQGWTGVAMTAVWGGAIATQFQIFKSISLAWVTHAIADAVMFSIIIITKA